MAMLGVPSVSSSSAALYVGDLDPDIEEAQLFDYFSQAFSVDSVRICRDLFNRRSLGYGYVNFRSAEDALEALEALNYTKINGKPIRIMRSHQDSSARRSGIGNLFVKNLHETIHNKELHKIFSPYGNILSSKVAFEDGRSRGHGFVNFETEEAAMLAIEQLNGITIKDKKLFVGKFVKQSERMLLEAEQKFTNLYVKNIDFDTTEETLKEKFLEYGKITNLIIMRDENERPKGFGFVNFESPDDAKKAVEAMNGAQLGSKVLFVGRAQKKAEREQLLRRQYEEKQSEWIQKFQGLNIYVKNLTDNVDEDMLQTHFAAYGNISSSKVMRDEKGISKGFGFVCFCSPEEAAKAVESRGFMLDGKPIYVAIAQRKEVRRAQLEQHYAQQIMELARPTGAMVSAPITPMYYAAPPELIPPLPSRQGMMYPGGLRPGWRPQPPLGRPSFQPTNFLSMAPQHGQMRNSVNGPGQVWNLPMALHEPQPQHSRQPPKHQTNGWGQEQERSLTQQHTTSGSIAYGQSDLNEWSSVLANASPQQQKQMLGERLYPLIQKHQYNLAAKITGMLLEMDNNELLLLLDSEDALASKVQEAEHVLQQHAKANQDALPSR